MLEAILTLLAGCGVFIAGMNLLSNGLEKSAGGGLKKLLGKISGNRFAGVGVGAGATAIIQSSSATTVMVIGFVNAGIMTLTQATAIIMGANVGTTITGILVSLKSLGISLWASTLAFVGVMMGFFKKDKIKDIGGILCGFGLIFVGLDVMGVAFDLPEVIDAFTGLFEKINFPLLLIVIGVLFTAVIQSSSAATGVFITMVGTGALTLDNALFLVLGSNIGTCVTALLACLGGNVNAKRTALIHLTFNVVGSALFTALIWPLKNTVVDIFEKVLPNNPQMQLAWFHVVFNVTTTLVLLPFIKQLVYFAVKMVREKKAPEETQHLKFVDDLLLKTPPVAVMQIKKELGYMADLARENIQTSFTALETGDEALLNQVLKTEEQINFINRSLTKYLIKLSGLVDLSNERKIGAYFHVLNDVERIGDHAENFAQMGVQMKEKGLQFSAAAHEELQEMQATVLQMFDIATHSFMSGKTDGLQTLTELESKTDFMKKDLSAKHFNRLAEGHCKVTLSPYFTSLIAGLERVADHLVNVGYSLVSPTGSQNQY